MENATHLGHIGPSNEVPAAGTSRMTTAGKRLAETIRGEILERTGGKIHDLRVEVRDTEVRLRGRCSTFYCKQLAQHAAMALIDGGSLTNEIEVA